MDCIQQVAISDYSGAEDNLRSVLESVNAALEMQRDLGVPPDRRFVILVGHSTGGIAIRKFMHDMGNKPARDCPDRTYNDVVKRILYVDVPHYGSPGENYLERLDPADREERS